jgi:peptidoglycan/LPS O-acetylase OafA/YrhL
LDAQSRPSRGEYRADIDGLRGFAVIAVVVFHAFPSIAPGGFVGVDVFFVISGYLISGLIIENLDRGGFSFTEFYCRRIKRIFPALIVVLIAVLLMGWLFLLAEEFKRLGKSIASAAMFVINFKYWREVGYFDYDVETKPLLHLWSLAVEEQFYIVWPFLLWAAWKIRLNFFVLALCLAIPSFILNVVHVQHHDLAAAFYSPGARFWELMLGAMLACARKSHLRRASPASHNAQSFGGLAAVCLAVMLVTRDADFPGWWALLPTVGTALIIAAPHAWLNRAVLSHPALVAMGLISYPLYLWHWPLLSFARIVEGETPPMAVRTGIVVLSIALAWITYRTVEKPIRYGARDVLKTCAALGAMMIAIGVTGTNLRAVLVVFPADVELANQGEIVNEDGHDVFFKYQLDHAYLCTPDYIQKKALRYNGLVRCVQSKPQDEKDIAIIGDSHAEDLFIGLAERLKDQNIVTYIQGALPLRSAKSFDEIFDYVESDKSIQAVILAASWDVRRKELPPGSTLETELTKTIASLVRSGKAVYLADVRPDFPFDPGVCKYIRYRFFAWQSQRAAHCDMQRSLFDAQQSKYHPALATVAEKFSNVRLLDATDVFCDEEFCRMAKDQVLVFRDRNHLTIAGSRAVADALISQVVRVPPGRASVTHQQRVQ